MLPEEIEKLIHGCMANDKKCQKTLYERFSPRMYALCLRYMPSREEAQDVLQDGFIKVFSRIHMYRFDGVFEGWMRRVFVNTALEALRKNKRKFEERLDSSIHSEPLVANEAEQMVHSKELMMALQKLALGYRTVFNLYIVEGYTHAEIAEQLGISESTSKSQLSRARVLLQEIVKKENVR